MTKTNRPFFSYCALRLKWQVIGFALVALSRAILRIKRTHGRGAWEMAAQLEVTARAAAYELGAELSDAYASAPPRTDDEIAALEHLTLMRTAFLVLVLLARSLQARLAGRGAEKHPCTVFVSEAARRAQMQTYAPAYLDSS